jgi:hypothetical protein
MAIAFDNNARTRNNRKKPSSRSVGFDFSLKTNAARIKLPDNNPFRDAIHATVSICTGCTTNKAAVVQPMKRLFVNLPISTNTNAVLTACKSRLVR